MDAKETLDFLKANAPYFRGYAHSAAGNADIGDDVTQNAWRKALVAMQKPQFSVRYPKSWMTTIILNELSNYRRTERAKGSGRWVPMEYDPPSDDDINPYEEAEREREVRKSLESILDGLSLDQKRVLEGLARGASYKEIGAEQRLPEGAIRARIYRLRQYLREQLRDKLGIVARYAS